MTHHNWSLLGILIVGSAILSFFFVMFSSGGESEASSKDPLPLDPFQDFTLLNTYNRDEIAFTQGLLFIDDETLAESSGLYGESEIRHLHVDFINKTISTGARRKIGKTLFGEGLAKLANGSLL